MHVMEPSPFVADRARLQSPRGALIGPHDEAWSAWRRWLPATGGMSTASVGLCLLRHRLDVAASCWWPTWCGLFWRKVCRTGGCGAGVRALRTAVATDL